MTDASSSRRPIRNTIDTNLFVNGLIRSGTPPNLLLRAWLRGAVRLVTSAALRAEVTDVLQRPKFVRYRLEANLMANVLDALTVLESVDPLAEAELPVRCRDPKDDMLIACALAAGVDYIVTGDGDLHALAGHRGIGSIGIITARDLLTLLDIDPDEQQRGRELEP